MTRSICLHFGSNKRRIAFSAGFGLLVICGAALTVWRFAAKPERVELHPVTGRLSINGQVAADAMISFHPVGESANSPLRHVAMTKVDGTYELMTFIPGDGAPVGEYAVTIVWPDDSTNYDECREDLTHDRLKGTYANAVTTPLRVQVGAGVNERHLQAVSPGGWSVPRQRDIAARR